MSHRFKRPKSHVNEGSIKARLIRTAKMIQTQDQLDTILAAADPKVVPGYLEIVTPFLRFTPRQPTLDKSSVS